MRKLITLLTVAITAIILTNNAFADSKVIVRKKSQYYIAADNTPGSKKEAKVYWYFKIDTVAKKAILVHPQKTDEENDIFDGIKEYTYTKLDSFPGWQGTWNQNMYNCWSPVIDNYYKNDEWSIATFYTAIQVPDSVNVINDIKYPVTEIGDSAFYNSAIQYINIPETIERIGKHAFANSEIIGQCEASPYQVIPNSVKVLGEGIFQNCGNLTRIEFGDGIDSIPASTFDGCSNLNQVLFGKSVKNINCEVNAEQVAFSADIPNGLDNVNSSEIWCRREFTDNFKNASPNSTTVNNFYIDLEKDTCYVYQKQWLKLNFTQKSYFKNPGAVYNYIYYYPAGKKTINFSVNALTGRGANKVRFRMILDNLDSILQANEVYQIIKGDSATSYSYLQYEFEGDYNVTLQSLDFTRAEAKVHIKVLEGTAATSIKLAGATTLNVGQSEQIVHLAVNSDGGSATGQEVKWSSSNESIATVDENGVVTALTPGVVTITANSLDICCPNAKGSLTITISDSEQESPNTPQSHNVVIDSSINVSTNGKDITIRSNSPLGKVEIYAIDGKLFKALNSTMNEEIVTLSSNGIYIVKVGNQTIKVTI